MAVNEVMRLGRARCPGDDRGMTGGRANLGFEADSFAMFDKPLCAGCHIRFVIRLRGDAGKSEVLAQFVEKALFILINVFQNGVHSARWII